MSGWENNQMSLQKNKCDISSYESLLTDINTMLEEIKLITLQATQIIEESRKLNNIN